MKRLAACLTLATLLSACGSTDGGGGPVNWGDQGDSFWHAACVEGHAWESRDLRSLAAAQGAARDHDLKEHGGEKTARVT